MNRAELAHLLCENSWRKYYIEYQGYRFNHIGQGIIALYRLGVDKERVDRFVDWCRQSLESTEKYDMDEIADNSRLLQLLGAHQSFYPLYNDYERQLQAHGGSLEKLIADRLPVLGPGLAGRAMHGIIQLGYGYAAGCPHMVCEGLAYMHFAYDAPTVSARGAVETAPTDQVDILDVLAEMRQDSTLSELIRSEMQKPEWQNRNTNEFLRAFEILFKCCGDQLMSLARKIRIPAGLTGTADVAKWALDSAVMVYAASEGRNDFYLLHGVTSAWGLLQVVAVVGDEDIERDVIRYFLCALLAAYGARGAPSLHLELLQGADADKTLKRRPDWDAVIRDMLSDDVNDKQAYKFVHEHVYKLVQVCYDMHQLTSDDTLKQIYLTAACVAIDYPLLFH